MAVWHSVNGLEDGESVCAEVLNRPVNELVSRTEYLKNKLDSLLESDARASLWTQVTLSRENTPQVGDVVCVDPVTSEYVKALATMSLYDAFAASEKAFAVGILVSAEGLTGTVVLYGKIDISCMDTKEMVEDREFVSGQYYLSSATPGKITRFPTGPRVLIGYFAAHALVNGDYSGGFAVINPQQLDIASHSHVAFPLLARPCGESTLLRTYYFDPGQVRAVGYYPDGIETPMGPEDPVDSTDSTDSAEPGPLVELFTGIPRMAVGGYWASRLDEEYTITVSGSTWPCTLKWKTAVSAETVVPVYYFGQEIPVGSHGMTVRLEPSKDMTEDSPVQADDVPEDGYTWTLGRDKGRGWSSAGMNEIVTLEPSGAIVRISGVSSRTFNDVRIVVPAKIFDLSDVDNPSPDDSLVIDSRTYTFTDDAGKSLDDGYVQILEDAYKTLSQLSEVEEKVFWCEDNDKRTILVGASTVTGLGLSVSDGLDNSDAGYAILAYATGEIFAGERQIGVQFLPVVELQQWSVNELANGQTATLVRGSPAVDDKGACSYRCVPGSVFRYMTSFDPDLQTWFPPVPATSGSLLFNGAEVESEGLFGSKSPLVIGHDSLYWCDDTPGRQPWPYEYMRHDDSVAAADECREVFRFVSEFHSETGPVTSLRPAPGSPVTVRRCNTGADATVGDLELDLDLTLGASDQNEPGYKVAKAFRGGSLLLGPVVERLVAGPGISFSRKEGVPEGQGTFTISADGTVYQGDFETIALENAKLASVGMFPYIRLLGWDPSSSTNIPTGFVAKFHLPATASSGVYRVKFYASVFGEESFTGSSARVAGISMDYNILPDYSAGEGSQGDANLKTGLISPDSSFTLDIPLGVQGEGTSIGYTAFDPVLMHNDSSLGTVYGRSVQVLDHSFPYPEDCQGYIEAHQGQITGAFGILPGYTVAVRFSRASPSTDGEYSSYAPYTGALGVLNLRWCVEEVATMSVATASATEDLVTQTVLNLRKAAARGGSMTTDYEVVNILKRLLSALK